MGLNPYRNSKGQYCSISNPSCRVCGVILTKENTLKGETRGYICKICSNEYHRTQRKNIPAELKSKKYRKHNLKRQLKVRGLSDKDYLQILNKQKGLCAICGLPQIGKNLAIDHNHNTGKFRGLLCQNCNQALGHLKVDDFGILNLQVAIRYLRDKI